MKRGMPSMVALLGLLAMAGYQNRDKLAGMFGRLGQPGDGQGGFLDKLGGLIGGATGGEVLHGGLGDLIDRFKHIGQGETADSWVKTGPNKPVSAEDLERAIGPDVLASLAQQTGLSREELLSRLTRALPEAVDTLTPEGRLPTPEEAAKTVAPPA
jgi:uncharacterized protein YidB (DUF937 family)